MNSKLEVTNLIQPILDLLSAAGDEVDVLLENGLSQYLHSQTDKYYKVNTFLHRYEKVRLDHIYYPLKAKYLRLETDFSNLTDVLLDYKYISIVGGAGSGKTMLTKFIFVTALKSGKFVPIYIKLRDLNDSNCSFEDYVLNLIINSNASPSSRIFDRHLKSGRFLFILDGFDEIVSDKRNRVTSNIENYIDRYPDNKFIITSRPGGGSERLPRFYDFEMLRLEPSEIADFVDKLVESSERKKQIVKLIGNPIENQFYSYLTSPLLLAMYILAVESHPEIPNRVSAFYWNVFDTLYSRHDGITKNSFPREKLTGMSKQDYLSILELFCYRTYFSEEYRFTESHLEENLSVVSNALELPCDVDLLKQDLETTISVLTKDGLEYEFPHRSMQEYFCARFISNLRSEDKNNFYKQYRQHHSSYVSNAVEHFWKLLSELDRVSFEQLFVIPECEFIITLLKSKSKEERVNTFYELFPYLAAELNSDEESVSDNTLSEPEFTMGFIPSKQYRIIEYINMLDRIPVVNNLKEAKHVFELGREQIRKKFSKGRIPMLKDLMNHGAYEYIASNYGSQIDDFIEELVRKKNELKNNQISKDLKIQSLLKISIPK